jgi:hypothetical protein
MRMRILAWPILGGACILGIVFTMRINLVKGNGDSMIYHTRDCSSYHATMMTNHPNDQWFFTETAARESGFRKANNCN